MIPYLRKKTIIETLQKKDICHLDELLELLEDSSLSTVRRDLKNLEEEGLIEILQGGAARLVSNSSYDMPLSSKQQIHMAEKDLIARIAAEQVKDGDVIYLDSGTTTLQMIKYLKNKRIQVITSNTLVLNYIEDALFICHILGGEIEKSLGSVFGPVTDNLLREMFFDKSFIGATGVSNLIGISTPDFREASKKKIAMEHSKKTFVLADSTKIGKDSLCKAFDLDRCTLITDKPVNDLLDVEEFIFIPEMGYGGV